MRQPTVTFSIVNNQTIVKPSQRTVTCLSLRIRFQAICLFAVNVIVFSMPFHVAAQDISNAAQDIGRIEQALEAGELKDATREVRRLDDNSARLSDVDTTLVLMRVARAAQKSGDNQTAAELCARALAASERPTAEALTSKQKALIQLTVGTTMFQSGKAAEAVQALADSIQPIDLLDDNQRRIATKLLIQIGGDALSNKDTELATNAYASAAKHGIEKLRATALLGQGWSLASDGNKHPMAAKVLNEFVDDYPDHPDVRRAAAVCVRCWQKSYRNDKADKLADTVFRRWPDSPEAMGLIHTYISLPNSRLPSSAEQWIIRRMVDGKVEDLAPSIAAVGLFMQMELGDQEKVDKLADRIAISDEDGAAVSTVLTKLTKNNQRTEAARLASRFIRPSNPNAANPNAANPNAANPNANSQTTEDQTTAAACEAACRWAANENQWTLLASASKSFQPSFDNDSQTIETERVLAESLMQVGKVGEAQRWWDHLVDVRKDTDFSTLLRCAESATAESEIAVAAKRIASVRLAVTNEAQKTMVQMLAAEMSIRKLEFDDARTTLVSVIENAEAIQSVRARAQWLVGETHFMQRNFLQAIEEYRKVDSIASDGPWIAASIVQAGKSFEQLGRTQEAKVCYSILVRRFANSPHVPLAEKRLAVLNPDSSTSTPTNQR